MGQLKWQCIDCEHIFMEKDFLKAPSPFNSNVTINGCPSCKSVDGFRNICDEEKCESEATCGWNHSNGYRRTCGSHYEKEPK